MPRDPLPAPRFPILARRLTRTIASSSDPLEPTTRSPRVRLRSELLSLDGAVSAASRAFPDDVVWTARLDFDLEDVDACLAGGEVPTDAVVELDAHWSRMNRVPVPAEKAVVDEAIAVAVLRTELSVRRLLEDPHELLRTASVMIVPGEVFAEDWLDRPLWGARWSRVPGSGFRFEARAAPARRRR